MGNETTELPRWRCHKVVEAFKIGEIHVPTDERDPDWEVRLWNVAGDHAIAVGSDYMNKHHPRRGGYYVRYADGYESFSPAEAFENGYQLMSPTWNPGQVVFEAYNTSRGGLNHLGKPTPPWAELPDEIRGAWHASAAALLSRAQDHLAANAPDGPPWPDD